MAKTNRTETARRNVNSARSGKNRVYADGNTVRRVAEVPERRRPPQHKQGTSPRKKQAHTPASRNRAVKKQVRTTSSRPHTSSRNLQRNREKSLGMSWGFVVFLTVMCTAILYCSVIYLQYKAQITTKIKNVAVLESELTQIKEDNDAYYSQVTSGIDLNHIKKSAIGRLGMKYPSEDQTVTYKTEGNSYLRQYQDIPEIK